MAENLRDMTEFHNRVYALIPTWCDGEDTEFKIECSPGNGKMYRVRMKSSPGHVFNIPKPKVIDAKKRRFTANRTSDADDRIATKIEEAVVTILTTDERRGMFVFKYFSRTDVVDLSNSAPEHFARIKRQR